jgi:hypothetical protein
MTSQPSQLGNGFIPVHIVPFTEGGRSFARCPEFRLVADGETEGQAVVALMHLLVASLAVAQGRGNLEAVVRRAGVEIIPAMPKRADSVPGNLLWFLPLLNNAHLAAAG